MSHSFHKSCQRGCGEMQFGWLPCVIPCLIPFLIFRNGESPGKPREVPGKQARIGRQFFFVKRKAGCLGSVAPWLRGSVAPFPFDSRGFPVDSSMFPCQRVATCGNMAQHVATCVNVCHVARHHAVQSVPRFDHRLHRSNSLRFPLKDFGCTRSVSE